MSEEKQLGLSRTIQNYTFKVRLDSHLCNECHEVLSDVVVRLYRPGEERSATVLAVAEVKETLALLSADEVKARSGRLLAEARTDASGTATLMLSRKDYDGGPFEIDVYCERVPQQKRSSQQRPPVQLSLTTVQPLWRKTESGALAGWQTTIPSRIWCAIRKRLGAWVVCGKVRDATTGQGLAGVLVHAFDTDIFQDDALGSASTDGMGHFRIDYAQEDFEKTIWPSINIEFFPGPDLYFHVTDSAGTLLLDEDRMVGRSPTRGNSDSCKCVTLDVELDGVPPIDIYSTPWFTHVGDYHIYANISATTGYGTTATGHRPNLAFTGELKLKGFVPKRNPANTTKHIQYRFRCLNLDELSEHPLTAAHIVPVTVGSRRIQWKLFDDTLAPTFQSVVIAPSGATINPTPLPSGPGPWGPIPDHVIVPDAEGWIEVDQEGLDSGFYGPLLKFNTRSVVGVGELPNDGVGNPVAPANQRNGASLQIVFEVAEVPPSGVGPSVIYSNTLGRIRVSNWPEVHLLALDQPVSVCSPIGNQLGIKYTVDHEMMEAWSIGLTNAAGVTPPIAPPLPSGSTPRGHSANPHGPIPTTGWPACSYTVSLHTRLALTNGESDDSGRTTSRTFCIQ